MTEATGTTNKAEARRLPQARLGRLAEGRYVGPATERVTFGDLAAMIMDDYRGNHRKTLAWDGSRCILPRSSTGGRRTKYPPQM